MSEEERLPILKIDPEDKKGDIRTKVWNYLADNNLASFPRPPHRRISNFRGADAAGDQIATMDIFTNAQILRVDPDKPLQQIRFKTLEAGKTLLVPTPRLKNHVFSKIVPPADCGTKLLRGCAARQGVEEYSEPVEIDAKIHVDLVVVGCVAVSTKGWRIGKGGGLSDLEYAMMVSMGVVDSQVIVVTMVHDCQVLDLSDDLFGPHDLPVDYIVTPTRVIKCDGNLPKPKGVIWSVLTPDKLNHIPVLRRLRFRELKVGNNVALEGETENPVDLEDVVLEDEEKDEKGRGFRGNFRRRERRRKDQDEADTTGEDDGKEKEKEKDEGSQRNRDDRRSNKKGGRFRSYRNRRYNRRTSENDSDNKQDSDDRSGKENRDEGEERGGRQAERNNSDNRREGRGGGGNRGYNDRGGYRKPGPWNRRRPVYDNNEGSVYVGSLPRSLRVSQFKIKVRERKVTPLRVLWRGSSGFAFLNFKTQQDAEEALVALEGLQISDKALRLEMARSGSEKMRRPRGARVSDQRDSQGEEEERAD